MFCIMSKKLPKYKEIEQDILSQIQSGRLKPGDQVMTEMELCNTYKVSRMTAHKALESLAVRGVVHRIAGKGTFVNSIHVNKKSPKSPASAPISVLLEWFLGRFLQNTISAMLRIFRISDTFLNLSQTKKFTVSAVYVQPMA